MNVKSQVHLSQIIILFFYKVEVLVVKKSQGSYGLVVLTGHGRGLSKLHVLIDCLSLTHSVVTLIP